MSEQSSKGKSSKSVPNSTNPKRSKIFLKYVGTNQTFWVRPKLQGKLLWQKAVFKKINFKNHASKLLLKKRCYAKNSVKRNDSRLCAKNLLNKDCV